MSVPRSLLKRKYQQIQHVLPLKHKTFFSSDKILCEKIYTEQKRRNKNSPVILHPPRDHNHCYTVMHALCSFYILTHKYFYSDTYVCMPFNIHMPIDPIFFSF